MKVLSPNFGETSLDGPPEGNESKHIGINENAGAEVTMPESPFEITRDAYITFTMYSDKHFIRKGDNDTGRRWAIENTSAVMTSGGLITGLALDEFYPDTMFNPKFKKSVSIRRRVIRKNVEGTPILPGLHIDAWKFCEDYTPDFASGWITESEWAKKLELLAPTIARDKRLADAEAEIREIESNRLAQAREARTNPEGYLARAIAQGVATVLADMKIKPSKN